MNIKILPKIPFTVAVLGVVSLFNDIASEMIYPIVPIFLTTVLGAPVAIVGFIEGIAEATASLMKFVFGYLSDRLARRKIFVVSGYGASSLSKLLIGTATSWPLVLFARVIDRFGKGLRTSARDSILLQNATAENKGFIFGFHRAMDSAGAVIGPILALVLLYIFKENIRTIFFIAFVPSVIGVVLLFLFVKEKRQGTKKKEIHIKLRWRGLNPSFQLFFLISMIFALGNSSDAFLILRAKNLGMATSIVVFTYILYNLSQTLLSTPAGSLADKIGARRVYAIGLLVFALVYFLFGIIHNPVWLWLLFPIYGIYIAFTDGVSKAYISEFIREEESGTYFGVYQTGTAVAGFLASLIGGLLWNRFSPSATFYYGAALSILAFLVLGFGKLVKKV